MKLMDVMTIRCDEIVIAVSERASAENSIKPNDQTHTHRYLLICLIDEILLVDYAASVVAPIYVKDE